MDKVRLEEMTWAEVDAAQQAGFNTIVVPAGATEEHGYHLPLGTDTLWADQYGEMVARRLGHALVAPVIPVGCSDTMMGFPGSMTLPEPLLTDLTLEYCRSLARHGFTRFVLISSHGGNFGAMRQAASRLQQEQPSLSVVTGLCDMQEILDVMHASVTQNGMTFDVAGAHGGEFETSVMLAVLPHLVHMDRARPGLVVDVRTLPLDFFRRDRREVSPTGVLGDPCPATPERGARYLDALVDAVVDKARQTFGQR